MSKPNKTFLCRVCEMPVPTSTGICEHCGFKHMKNFKAKFFLIMLCVVLLFAGITYNSFFTKDLDVFDNVTQATPASGEMLPEQEIKFIDLLMQYQDEYEHSEEQKSKGAFADPITLRAQRRQALTSLNLGLKVENWVGRVSFLQQIDDENIALSINISPDVSLETAKSQLRDFETNTLIKKYSPVYHQIMQLKTGDVISFDGNFYACNKDIFKEISPSMHSCMMSPTFLFRFNNITKTVLSSDTLTK